LPTIAEKHPTDSWFWFGGGPKLPSAGRNDDPDLSEDDMPTQDEIFQKVQATLVDALGVDEEDVTRGATLQGDLGAESIDFLDIVFRLERNFGIKIPRGELFPENIVSDPEMIHSGKLTAKGLEELRARMPYADLSGFASNPEVDKIGELYTVDMLVQYVQSKLST
jgi:acyl carrier protein